MKEAVKIILEGGTVIFPTETVYGLGANALNAEAVKKIYALKKRPLSHPLIVHCSSKEEAFKLAKNIPKKAFDLADKFWPGPLTLLLEKNEIIPNVVTANKPSIALRVPSHKIALEFLKLAGVPIAAPSANEFSTLSPTHTKHLNLSADYILEGEASEVGVESTIVSFLEGTPRILRPGGVSREQIEEVIGKVEVATDKSAPITSGMLKHHYAPKTKLILYEDRLKEKNLDGFCILKVLGSQKNSLNLPEKVLSQKNSYSEAAANLFETLHQIDKEQWKGVIVFLAEEKDLGSAINDRLRKAAASFIQ
jgi:L-threonylcarbamoyladenylate synthase